MAALDFDPSNRAVTVMEREPRLRFQVQSQGAVWSHVDAARNHLLIDPRAQARARTAGFVRPIELWSAPRWQRPPSVAVVRYTEIGDSGPVEDTDDQVSDVPPVVGDVVNRSSVVDFLSDSAVFRLGAFGALIDAVAAALTGGPPVVLAAPTAEEGAFWIGAVSFFASPQTSLRLSFSTFERWDDVLEQILEQNKDDDENDEDDDEADENGARRPSVISVVPESDVDRLTRADELPVVVIDPRVEATPASIGGDEYRRTHLGQEIAVTDWSRLALEVCCEDPADLERCLRWLDEVSLAPTAATEPGDETEREDQAWPLAAAIIFTDDLPLARPTATRVIRRTAQTEARPPAALAGTLTSLVEASLVEAAGEDAEPAWNRLSAADPDPAAFEAYLRAALADDRWLIRQAPPLPAELPPDPDRARRLRAPLAGFVHRLTHDLGPDEDTDEPADVRRGLLLLRGVDFAHRIAVLVGGPDLVAVGVGRLGARAAEVLLDPDVGPRVAEIVGPLDGSGLARWIVPVLTRSSEPWLTGSGAVGERLPAPVIALLARAVDPARLTASPQVDTSVSQSVALEVAVASASGRIAGDPRLRGPAVEYLLQAAADSYPDADPGPMVAEVFDRLRTDEPWPTAALLRVIERAPATLGAELVPIVLTHLPHWIDDPLSGRLAAALLKRIEFLPRLGGDGQPRPRRAGTTDSQAQLLNLLAATGAGWAVMDDGLHPRAAEILMWADRAWPGVSPQVQRLIAPRVTVAAFQVALAAEPDQARTTLRSRLDVVPMGSGWRSAVAIGLESARPQIAEVLRLNRYRLAGEVVIATTRALLDPDGTDADRPRLARLPVAAVIGWLVRTDDRPELTEHLTALADQELRLHPGPDAEGRPDSEGGPDPEARAVVREFWADVLPGAVIGGVDPSPFPESLLGDAVSVALGTATRPTGYPSTGSLIESLIESSGPVVQRPGAERPAGESPAHTAASHSPAWSATKLRAPAHRARPPWWRRWNPR